MISQKYLKYLYGPSSAFSEYNPGDVIRYLEEGRENSGTILWVGAPSARGNRYIGMIYVVQPQGSRRSDLVSPANVLTPFEKALG
jgi:hypothetical protein